MRPLIDFPSEPVAASEQLATPTRAPRWYRDIAVLTGSLGILCFSLTLPATHLAVPMFGSVVVGLGRALIAAVLAGIILLVRRESLPPRHTWPSLLVVACGVV